MRKFFAFLSFLVLTSPVLAAPCEAPDMLTRVSGRNECLIIRTFEKKGETGPRVLYVLHHGNHSDGSPGTSMYKVAPVLIEKAPPNTIAVALLRPGYNDNEGNYSTGHSNRNDSWGGDIIDEVAQAIANLKNFHKADRVVLIGHSAGSAVSGVILGRHPGLADAALLVGCVCDMLQWRSGRAGVWTSLSPSDYVDKIPTQTKISVLVGVGDTVTMPSLSESYVGQLAERGFAVRFKIAEGRDHYDIIRSGHMYDMALKLGEFE